MWIIRVALKRPSTFIVLALLILILSPVVILRTPTDILPSINSRRTVFHEHGRNIAH
jgi:multidrug efflux pump subunit AcrB